MYCIHSRSPTPAWPRARASHTDMSSNDSGVLPKSRLRFAVVGLPSVGKSTFVAALHGKSGEAIPPTEGCNKSNVARGDLTIDILDLGGKMAVRKFWKQMTMEADGFICVVNASEADDLSWMMIGQEVRMLREGRPVLLLLNRREAPERVCVSPKEALERLGLHETAGVQIEIIAASADVASADSGIAWLCDEVTNPLASRGASPFGTPPNSSPAQSPGPGRASQGADGHGMRSPRPPPTTDEDEQVMRPPPPSGSRMRALRGLRDAREYASAEQDHVQELQRRLMEGHILSTEELEMVRAANR